MAIDLKLAFERALNNARKSVAVLPWSRHKDIDDSFAATVEAAQQRVLDALPTEEDREALAVFLVRHSLVINDRVKSLGGQVVLPSSVRNAGETDKDYAKRQRPAPPAWVAEVVKERA